MRESNLPEQFIALVQVLAEDDALKSWLESLALLPANRRYSELGHLSQQLRESAQEELGGLIMALNDEQIFQSIRTVLAAMK